MQTGREVDDHYDLISYSYLNSCTSQIKSTCYILCKLLFDFHGYNLHKLISSIVANPLNWLSQNSFKWP